MRVDNSRVGHRLWGVLATLAIALGVASPARAGTVVIDFEALSGLTTASPHMVNASAYLAGYGVTVSGLDPGSALFAVNELWTYSSGTGGVVDAPSGIIYVTQAEAFPDGTPTGGALHGSPNDFTLNFSTALTSFAFSDSAILAPSINASWTARAYSGLGGTGTLLSTTSYSPPSTHPSVGFLLSGSGILSVTFDQTFCSCAAFAAGNFDDFVLTGPGIGVTVAEPPTVALMAFALFGLFAFNVRARARGFSRPGIVRVLAAIR